MLRLPRCLAAPVLIAGLVAGCGGGDEPTAETPVSTDPPEISQPAERPVWFSSLELAEKSLDKGQLDAVSEQLEVAEKALSEAGKSEPALEGQVRLKELKVQLASARTAERERQAEEKEQRRAARLAEATELSQAGKLDEATQALEDVLAMTPTAVQRDAVRKLKDGIETHRAARRRLGSWMKMLGSKTRSEVRAAQNQLRRDPDTALPLLIEAVRTPEKPVLVRNTLEMLRRLRRPEVAIPEMVGVLRRPGQQANWPDAVRELSQLKDPGAGPLLLKLLRDAKPPEQRAAALAALAEIPDPPAETLLVLLPVLHADGAALEPALQAAHTAMTRHAQQDLVALRGLPGNIPAESQQLLARLPERLKQLAALTGDQQTAVANAARGLAVVVGVIEPGPLKNVKVVSAVAEAEEGPAAAVLDGKWTSTESTTMWRHPLGKPGTIILDLGSERTVSAVRVWNFNQQGGAHRGWKEVDVFVSNSRSDLTPESSGVVPPAPGADDTPDFSTVFPVELVRGRYVILKARSLWQSDAYSGLSEVQVIGY